MTRRYTNPRLPYVYLCLQSLRVRAKLACAHLYEQFNATTCAQTSSYVVKDEVEFQLYGALRAGDQLLVLQFIPLHLAAFYLRTNNKNSITASRNSRQAQMHNSRKGLSIFKTQWKSSGQLKGKYECVQCTPESESEVRIWKHKGAHCQHFLMCQSSGRSANTQRYKCRKPLKKFLTAYKVVTSFTFT